MRVVPAWVQLVVDAVSVYISICASMWLWMHVSVSISFEQRSKYPAVESSTREEVWI